MTELVGHNNLGALLLGELIGKTADSVLHANFHGRWREHFLEARQFDSTAGKTVVGDERGSFGKGHLEIGLAQSLAVECTKVAPYWGSRPLQGTEALLAAYIERKLCFQVGIVLAQEANQTAEVVVMAMAQNRRVQRARIDLQQIKVVDQGFWCEAEVHESAPPFLSALRLNMQREAELADQGLAGRFIAEPPAEASDVDIPHLCIRCDGELIVIDNHADRDAVDLRYGTEDRGGSRRLCIPKQSREHGIQESGATPTDEIAPVHRGIFGCGHGSASELSPSGRALCAEQTQSQ